MYDPLFKPCWYTQGPFERATQGVRVDGISFTEFAGRSGDSPRYGPERSGSDALLRAHGGAGMFAKQIMREQGAEGFGDSRLTCKTLCFKVSLWAWLAGQNGPLHSDSLSPLVVPAHSWTFSVQKAASAYDGDIKVVATGRRD